MEATAPTFSPHSTASMMTVEDARRRVVTINAAINNVRFLILDFHDRKGWKALGYETWEQCVEKEFEQGRRYIFYQLQAARIEKNINDIAKTECTTVHSEPAPPEPEPIPERILRPLAAVPPEDQASIYHLAKETAPEGKLTGEHVEKVVRQLSNRPPREPLTVLAKMKRIWLTATEEERKDFLGWADEEGCR